MSTQANEMPNMQSMCQLDDTWEDALTLFRDTLSDKKTWSCFCMEGVDKEVILSAPEIMDPKTDSGFGCHDIHSLEHLLRTEAIPPVASLTSEAALVDLMDFIHVKELHYLEGYSLVQSYLAFPYFLRLDLLKEQNPVLYAYCRGVLRCLDCVVRAIFATTIRSDEEFMLPSPELDRQADCAVEEILAELETAACNASPAVAARLRFRKQLLSALTLFLESKRVSDAEAACELCQSALDLLNSPAYQRTAEPTVDPRLWREREMVYWTSVITPTSPLSVPAFAVAMAAYKTLLQQLISLKSLLGPISLDGVVDFVEHLGAQQPLLLMRCLTVVLLFSCDPQQSFLYGPPLAQRLLEVLSHEYGAPLYQRLMEGDEASLTAVVRYRIQKLMEDPRKVTQEQQQYLRDQTIETLQRWAAEASKFFLLHLETMLCNRGLAHRRLMNMLTGLAQLQELSYATDLSFFAAGHPGCSGKHEAECLRCSPVLTLFANTYTLRTMELVLDFFIELDLLAQGELIPALWYLNFVQRAQIENLSTLCLRHTDFIPQTRVNKKTQVPLYNMALTTRTTGALDVVRATLLDTARTLSDAVFLSGCLFEAKKLIDLTSAPPGSLSTIENIFNHRMLKCFGNVRGTPFASYQRCVGAKPTFTGDTDKIPLYARKASEIARGAAEKARALLSNSEVEAVRRECLRGYIEKLEKTSRAVSASLASFAVLCEDDAMLAGYHATVERPAAPSLLCFTLHKKTKASSS